MNTHRERLDMGLICYETLLLNSMHSAVPLFTLGLISFDDDDDDDDDEVRRVCKTPGDPCRCLLLGLNSSPFSLLDYVVH